MLHAATVVAPIALYFYVVVAVGFADWGGFMLNLFLALCSIILCYPLGVLLALGRRSKLPLVRAVCTSYVELVRGAPLFVLLLFANVALGFLNPHYFLGGNMTLDRVRSVAAIGPGLRLAGQNIDLNRKMMCDSGRRIAQRSAGLHPGHPNLDPIE